MNILWLTEFYPKEDKMIGGVQARCYYVGKEISKENNLKIIEGVSEKHAEASFGSFIIRLFNFPSQIIQGLQSDFDLVEASNFVMFLPAWIIGKIKQKPIVFWYPDVYISSWVNNVGSVGIVGELVERIILFLGADHYIAISEVVKNKLITHGISPQKITVIYCGIDEGEISHIKIKNKKRDLIAVSRLVKYKKIDQIISTLDPDTTLAIIGWGPEEKALKKMSGKNVTFLGIIPSHKDVLTEIAQSKILCHPSVVEGFGISIIEALALGVPVLLADTHIAREITHDWQGALPFAAENINKLLTDKQLYARKFKEGKALAKVYSWKRIAEETEQLYEHVKKS